MHTTLGVGGSVIALLVAARMPSPPPGDDEITWHTDLAAARELARRDGRPLLLVFR